MLGDGNVGDFLYSSSVQVSEAVKTIYREQTTIYRLTKVTKIIKEIKEHLQSVPDMSYLPSLEELEQNSLPPTSLLHRF